MARQYHFPLPCHESMGLEDFLPAPSNQEAVVWLIQQAPAQWPSHALTLWGPEGTGKTHLLSVWAKTNHAAPATQDPALLGAIVNGQTPAPAFTLDDADQLAGHPAQEEWLQHFFNATKAARLPLLLTARRPPAQWGLSLKDIETRLKSTTTIALNEPDDELARGMMLKLFADRQLLIETGVVEYLAQRTQRSGQAIRDLVARLDEASLETGRKISIPFVQQWLARQTD